MKHKMTRPKSKRGKMAKEMPRNKPREPQTENEIKERLGWLEYHRTQLKTPNGFNAYRAINYQERVTNEIQKLRAKLEKIQNAKQISK